MCFPSLPSIKRESESATRIERCCSPVIPHRGCSVGNILTPFLLGIVGVVAFHSTQGVVSCALNHGRRKMWVIVSHLLVQLFMCCFRACGAIILRPFCMSIENVSVSISCILDPLQCLIINIKKNLHCSCHVLLFLRFHSSCTLLSLSGCYDMIIVHDVY